MPLETHPTSHGPRIHDGGYWAEPPSGALPRRLTDAAVARRRGRWWATGGVAALVFAFQLTSEPTPGGIPSPVVSLAVTAVVINGGLSVYERYIERLSLGTLRTAVGGLLISLMLGVPTGALLSFTMVNLEVLRWHIVPPDGASPWRGVVMAAFVAVFHAGVWLLAFFIPSVAEREQVRSLELANLRLEAAEARAAAELAKLRAQLEPHFLLNTLNLISGLVSLDPAKARRLIGCLGDLLRDALEGSEGVHTVGEEIEWLRRYVEILESRHGDLLTVRWEIQEESRAAVIPRLLLQPLVENAMKHGVLRRRGGGEIVIRAEKRGNGAESRLVYEVEDTGPGLGAKPPRGGGVGLANVRRRIELGCPGGTLQLVSSEAGTRAVIDIPFTTARPGAAVAGEPR